MSWTLLIEADPPKIDFMMMRNKLLIYTLPEGKSGFLDRLTFTFWQTSTASLVAPRQENGHQTKY